MDINQNLPQIALIIACISFVITLFNTFSVDAQRVRLRTLLQSLQGLEWDQVASLLGDVERLKVSLQRLNGRISGMATTPFNLESEKAKARAGLFRSQNGDT
jgi:uncharacterized protein YigE (DUF2233 family)